ncbi:hypothetical protein RN001_004117 [Aquatica leii]|uniref:CCHC-type domain-containing protein n=1 Tax=Aquatica leii TaxID=1421715 RepID=A0AAN7PPR3_9COLE|nr:hypothetical protein RN001_004117 [Aquatica leii]
MESFSNNHQGGGESGPDPRRNRPDVRSNEDMVGGSFPRTGATRKNASEKVFPPLKEILGTSGKEDSVPRFLVLKKKESDFANTSPFLISKTLYGLIGNVKEVQKVKGELLIETVSSKQSKQLIKCESFGGCEIEVVPHGTLNMSKGVVYCRDLLNCSINEIKENLKIQGVVDVRRIKTRRDGELIDTANHILTFNVTKLPRVIQAAFYPLQVRPYIPNPLRCFNCQRFGHSSVNCKHDKRCVCGKPTHEGSWCEEPIVCPNCQGQHKATAKTCAVFRQEMKIQKVKIVHRLSYFDAKKKVHTMVTPSTSFAQVATAPARIPIQAVQAIGPEIKSIDVKELERELLPRLVDALKAVFALRNDSTEEVTGTKLTLDINRENKKRKDDQRTPPEKKSCIEGSQPSFSQQTDTNMVKKPRGWPKGKTRKPRDESQDSLRSRSTSRESTHKGG